MIIYPPGMVATRIHGYYWHIEKQQLFTQKVTGILRPLVLRKANQWNHHMAGYAVSHNGIKRYITLAELKKLVPADSMAPVVKGYKY